SDGLFEDLLASANFEPFANHSLWQGTERFSPNGSRAHDLDEISEHLSVVCDSRKDAFEKFLVTDRKNGQQQGGHVFHVTLFASEDRGLCDEVRLDLIRECQDLVELFTRIGVKGVIKAAGRGILSKSRLWRELVS